MSYATNLRCRECGRLYQLDPAHVCDFCFGPLEVMYDYEALRRRLSRQRIEGGASSMWRYADLLPADPEATIDLGVGFTPLLPAANLGRALGLSRLYIKNDCVNP
ncbi:MAG: threonine synthase, partial [Dehalococcoidia bacterium]